MPPNFNNRPNAVRHRQCWVTVSRRWPDRRRISPRPPRRNQPKKAHRLLTPQQRVPTTLIPLHFMLPCRALKTFSHLRSGVERPWNRPLRPLNGQSLRSNGRVSLWHVASRSPLRSWMRSLQNKICLTMWQPQASFYPLRCSLMAGKRRRVNVAIVMIPLHSARDRSLYAHRERLRPRRR